MSAIVSLQETKRGRKKRHYYTEGHDTDSTAPASFGFRLFSIKKPGQVCRSLKLAYDMPFN